MHRDPLADEGRQHVLGHVLVVEGDDIDIAGEGEHGVSVAVIADRGRRQRGGHPLFLCEHSQLDPELDRRGDHHARQLSSADHSDSQRHAAPFVASIIPHVPRAAKTAAGRAAAVREAAERVAEAGRRGAPGSG
jgi:hypothetical protein